MMSTTNQPSPKGSTMTTTRRLLAVTATALVAILSLAACQPAPGPAPAKPPADAITVNATRGDAFLVYWSAGALVCTGNLTVAKPDGTVAYQAAGMAASGSVFLTAATDGPLMVWVRSSSSRCDTSLDVRPNISE